MLWSHFLGHSLRHKIKHKPIAFYTCLRSAESKNISSVKKAKFRVEEKKLLFDDISNQVSIDTANAWTNYNSSKSILDATTAQLKAAEIANEGITLEYDTGNERTTLEVIQSRTLLLEARTSYANAQKNFAIAQFSLLASIGDLFLENIR